MASEEKYLWVFRFQVHGKNCAWWAYFSDKREAQAFIDGLMAAIPCIEARSLEEQMAGVRLYPFIITISILISNAQTACLEMRWLNTMGN